MTKVKIFFTSLVLLFFVFTDQSKAQKSPLSSLYYRDTASRYKDLTFDFRLNRSRFYWFKTTVYITNPSNNYMIFNVKGISVKTPYSKRVKVHKNRAVIIGPRQELRYAMRFDGMHLHKDSVHFQMNQAITSDQLSSNFETFKMKATGGNIVKTGDLTIVVLKVERTSKYYKVRVKMLYDKDERFLSIDFANISSRTKDGYVLKNRVKQNYITWLTRSKRWEPKTFVFPIEAGAQPDGYIYFEDVFKEYTLREVKDFDLQVLMRAYNK